MATNEMHLRKGYLEDCGNARAPSQDGCFRQLRYTFRRLIKIGLLPATAAERRSSKVCQEGLPTPFPGSRC
ncbi:hypothetical protein V1264_021012 [Littorina saxatilis]|uniref:Uncharacterized protein n=1 Tax=Littorina saxatilis TaxID=31220 RepID=A0AAN9BC90_9CAEN